MKYLIGLILFFAACRPLKPDTLIGKRVYKIDTIIWKKDPPPFRPQKISYHWEGEYCTVEYTHKTVIFIRRKP